MHKLRVSLILVAFLSLIGPSVASLRAQQDSLEAIGIPPFTAILPVENGYINTVNGDLHLEIPLADIPVRAGRRFKAALMYDSNIWKALPPAAGLYPDNVGSTDWGGKGLGGWRLVTSADPGHVGYSVNTTSCRIDYSTEYMDYSGFFYAAPDGTTISFPIHTEQILQTRCRPAGGTPSGDAVAPNGSGYHMYVTNFTEATVYAPDGTRVYGPSGIDQEDPNGNYASGNFSSWYWYSPATDALGRNIVTTTASGNNIYFDILNSQGTTSRYTGTTEGINTNAGSPNFPYPGTLTVFQSIQLPDGTSYSFQYDSATSAGPPYHYGILTSMTMPTGGTITYSYGQPITDYSPGLNSRLTPDSATPWTYVYQQLAGCGITQNGQYQLTVTKPSGDNEVYTFTIPSSPYSTVPGFCSLYEPTQLQTYSGSVSATNLVATLTQTFNANPCASTTWFCSYIMKIADTITLPIPGGTSINRTNQYTWDSGGPNGSSQYGQLLTKKEWNFYTGSLPASPDRTTTYTYLGGPGSGYLNSNANILDRPTSVTVTNSSGATVAKTLNCYDYAGGCGGSSFADAGSITNHDTTFGPSYTFRGDLTQTQRLIGGSSYLTKSMTYDTAGQLRSATDWSNLSTHITNYSYGDSYVNDNTTNSEPLNTYSPSQATDGYPTTVTAPLSAASMTYTYYYGTGQKSSATDANGKTSYGHFGDPLDRPTSTKLPPTALGSPWTYFVYAGANTIDKGTGITSPTLSISCTGVGDCRHDQTHLEGLGRTDHQYLVSDPDGQSAVDTSYDSNGRAKSVSNPHRTVSFTTDGTEEYPSYDGLDRKLQVTRADGSNAYTYYGVAVSSNGGRSSQLCSGYGVGYPILTKDEASRLRQTWTDGFGRLIEVDEPDPSTGSLTSGAYAGTCYAYDLNNNLIGVSSLGGSEAKCPWSATYNRCFTYDMASRLLSAYNPESNTTTYVYDQDTNCPSPSSFPSQLVSKTDARSYRSCFQYDNLNRVTQKNYPSSTTPTVTYSYDSTSCLDLTQSCYNLTRRTGMTDGSGQTNWAYDAVGNMLEEKRTIGTATKKIFYTYNLDSSVATIQYPGGRTITYQAGDAQRPLSAVDSGSSISYATLAHYAPPRELASLTNGSSFYFTSIFNNRLQPCWAYATTGTALPWNSTNTSFCTNSATAGTILDMKFSFNWGTTDNGNVIGTTNNRDSTRSQAFTYDYLNRLYIAETTSTYSTSPANCWAEQYGIDAVANLTSIAPPTGSNNYNGCVQESGLSASVSGANQFTNYCYDASGNLLGPAAPPPASPCSPLPTTYAYDSESRLTSTAGVTYTYDGDGKRVKKSGGTLYWLGTGGDTLAESDTSGNVTNEYIYFGGKRIARRDSSNNVFYYFSDQLGTAREIVEAGSTSPCYEADLYPFGGERVAKNSQGQSIDSCDSHYKLTGKERDPESGLDDFGARYYSSHYGRFMSPDWAANATAVPFADFSDPQSLNLYSYARNNPSSRTDPSGHCDVGTEHHGFWWCLGHAIGATETRQEYDTRISTERQWLLTNARNENGSALSSSQHGALSGASSAQIDSLYQGYARTIAIKQLFAFDTSDEAISNDPKDWGRTENGALVPLVRPHSDATIMEGNKTSYDFWQNKSTSEIIESLKEGSKYGELTVKPNGMVMNGNTRIKILEERGVDVDGLERVIFEGGELLP